MKTILFLDPNLNERGTSIATYDYAHFNEEILNNKSIIVSYKQAQKLSYEKFNKRFETHLIDSPDQLSSIKCDYMYVQKYGFNDGILHKEAKNLIHTVFPCHDPHGDTYAYISEWLSINYNNSPFVSYMVNLPDTEAHLKNTLNLKQNIIIGWYGGNNFDIPFVRKAVEDISKIRKDITFLFMNQDPFIQSERVIFLKGTTDQLEKTKFINTCDCMIHARERGETFGLAIAEFSTKNKPIITYANSPEKAHNHILKNKGIYYEDYNSLMNILLNISKSSLQGDWNCYKQFDPKSIMKQFNQIFLQ